MVAKTTKPVWNEDAMDAALEELDIKIGEDASIESKLKALRKKFKDFEGKNLLADCDNCGEASLKTLDRCPFCGDADEVVPAAPEPEPEEEQEDETETPEEPAEEEPDADVPSSEESEPGIAIDPSKLEAGNDAPKEEQKKVRLKRAPVAKAKKTPAQSELGMATTTPSGKEGLALAASLKTLDEKVAEIKALDTKTGEAAWKLAERLVELDKGQLWKLRTAEDGKHYRTYEQFCKSIFDMSTEYVMGLKKAFVRFDKSDFILAGPTKIRLLLQAPKDQQNEVLQKLKRDGLSKKELAREIKDKRKKAGMKAGAVEGKREGVKKPVVQKDGKVTVAVVLGRQTTKCFKKPLKDGDDPVPAKRLADHPYGYVDLSNDVRLYMRVKQNPAGEISFQIEFRRIEE
jgi:hypothetical protein